MLKQAISLLANASRVDIRLDEAALKAAGVSPDDKVPLSFSGAISLRSLLNLLLDAHGLTFIADDKGLLVTTRKPGDSARH